MVLNGHSKRQLLSFKRTNLAKEALIYNRFGEAKLMAWFIAIFTVLSVLTGLEGSTNCRIQQKCFSENYTYTACQFSDDKMLVNVTIGTEISKSDCNFYNDSYENYNETEGVYGYCEGTIWVDKGCRAYFSYCITDMSATEARNCTSEIKPPSPPSSLSTTYTSGTPNITSATFPTPNRTASDPSNITSPSTSDTNNTSPVPSGSTPASTNEAHDEENSTTSTTTSFSSSSSTDTTLTSSTSYTAMSSTDGITDCPEDGDDDDVWKLPVYMGIIIIVAVLGIFLFCGILLVCLICKRRNRCSDEIVDDKRDTSDWKTQNLKRYLTEELSNSVKNSSTVGAKFQTHTSEASDHTEFKSSKRAVNEVPNGSHLEQMEKRGYLTPISEAKSRMKDVDKKTASFEESVGYLTARSEDEISFLNPTFKAENTDEMQHGGMIKLPKQTDGSQITNTNVFLDIDKDQQADVYDYIEPIDVKATACLDDNLTKNSKL